MRFFKKINFDTLNQPNDKNILIFLLVLFFSLVILKIHGFSFAALPGHLHISAKAGDVLYSEPQLIRSDDWLATLPFAKAQIEHKPPFPVHNTLIFKSSNMLSLAVPAIHPATLFKPATWGYFFSFDTGVAWMWQMRIFGLIFAAYMFFRHLFKLNPIPSISLGLILLYSPFVQFWSLNNATLISSALLSCWAFDRIWRASDFRSSLLWGLAFGWFSGIMAFTFYPPYQITFAYICIAIGIPSMLCHFKKEYIRHYALAFSSSLLVLAVGLGSFFYSSMDLVNKLSQTSYPGSRFFNGGGMPIERILHPSYFLSDRTGDWYQFGNICEAAGFPNFLPLTLIALVMMSVTRKSFWKHLVNEEKKSFFQLSTLLITSLFFIYFLWLGFPTWLAKYSLMSQVLPQRATGALGVSTICLLAISYKLIEKNKAAKSTFFNMACAVMLSLFVGLVFVYYGKTVGDILKIEAKFIERASIGWMIVSFLFLMRKKAALIILVTFSIYSTAFFNPIVHGTSGFPEKTELGRVLIEIHERHPDLKWIVTDSASMGTYLRMLGIPAFSGTSFEPQLEFFEDMLGPEQSKLQRHIYNRFSYVEGGVKEGEEGSVELIAQDAFRYKAPLDNKAFIKKHQIGVVMTFKNSKQAKIMKKRKDIDEIQSLKSWSIFRINSSSK